MQNINLSPTDLGGGPRENQRNYVFVDEHNRHKRLKVMRACEGCRRRKIKCDAATTNTWPCSACVRLKLNCVPPMVQYDRDYASNHAFLEHDPSTGFYDNTGGDEELIHGQVLRKASHASIPNYAHRGSINYRLSPQEQHPPSAVPGSMPYSAMPAGEAVEPPMSNLQQFSPHSQFQPAPQPVQRQPDWQAENDYTTALVGQLRIDDTGVASYISAQGRRLAETPAYESWAEDLEPNPSFAPGQHEYAVRIRPEDMPPENEAMEMFNIFFNHIHPYLPIVNKAAFFRQWRTSRESISPLLLESMFACAGRFTNDPAKGNKWLALATKHVDCFYDVGRLSTVQAMILILKARENSPQRGYFFRSWMSVVNIVAMARDLGLEAHHELHKQGMGCGDSPLDCMTSTRVWQACFVYELMICAPQGRSVMQCNPESIDTTMPMRISTDLDEHEVTVHRNFIQYVCLVRQIRKMNDIHIKLKANPSWRNDPQFLESGPSLDQWSYNLPPNLHVPVSTDLSQPPPQFENHFVGNLQAYYHLARILMHRPALQYSKNFTTGGEWRTHMAICVNAAKSIYRLEETIFDQYGMLGLQCMLRGVNFAIYTLLSSVMIHLIAATCPDPEFNVEAKDYFAKTMRLLENCIDSSASSETKGQIEGLREAFSADVSRPFVLRPSFPFYNGVPTPVDPQIGRAYTQADVVQSTMAPNAAYVNHPVSPPHSIGENETKGESPSAVQSLVMLAAGQGAQPPTSGPMVEHVVWNPSRLFDTWNTAFGMNGSMNPTTAAMSAAPLHAHHHDSGLVDSLGVFNEHQKRPYPFAGENMWSAGPSPHERSSVPTPTTAAVATADGGTGGRGSNQRQ